jgi:hypothetical protein
MAATQIIFLGHFVDGTGPFSFKCYAAANGAVGTYCPVRLFGDATSTDSVDLKVPKNAIIDDIQSSCASGMIRFESDGAPTYALVDLSSRGSTNSGRVTNMGIPLGASHNYRLKVEVVLPA